ncbi:MAG: M20 family metallopeptidase [Draconibacterium sp.]|nr:M20 family metallopeptidase [Draconibacterium sp.]
MNSLNVISLTQKLIAFNTINPPGNEKELAKYVGNLLSENGFDVEYILFEENRLHVIAEKGLSETALPVVFSGHLDTVPLGAKKWSFAPFAGEIFDGKIYGRGSTDMKAGVAAIIVAAIQSFKNSSPKGGVKLVITAGEELGCQGAQHLAKTYKKWGKASGLIIAEPTTNIPVIGHKGGLYMNVSTTGITAHSSMPELGVNAIYKAAKAISVIENFSFEAEKDSLLGMPTINVGKMSGGMNLNSVPDHAEFTIDVRSTTKVNHTEIIQKINNELGEDTNIEILVNLPPVSTNENQPFVQLVYDVCKVDPTSSEFPKALPYLTDGSVLQSAFNNVPTIILGPGQPEMAHQTDEFCYIEKIEEAVEIYKIIIDRNGKLS